MNDNTKTSKVRTSSATAGGLGDLFGAGSPNSTHNVQRTMKLKQISKVNVNSEVNMRVEVTMRPEYDHNSDESDDDSSGSNDNHESGRSQQQAKPFKSSIMNASDTESESGEEEPEDQVIESKSNYEQMDGRSSLSDENDDMNDEVAALYDTSAIDLFAPAGSKRRARKQVNYTD